MIKVLDSSFSTLGSLSNLVSGTVTKEDSGSWNISLAVTYDNPLSGHLTRKNYLEFEGQKFSIRQAITTRQGEEKYVKVSAEHVIHELEDHIVLDEYEVTGTMEDHIRELLTHQRGSDFTYDVRMGDIERTITISPGTLAEGLKTILDNYSAKLLFDNHVVKPVPRTFSTPSNIVMEYSVQNNNISRNYSREGVVTRLICRAKIKIKEGEAQPGEVVGGYREVEETYGGSNGYRHGVTRLMDLGALDSMEDLNAIANSFLDVYAEPDASYELDVAELKRIGNINELYPGRDFVFDTGLEVTVKDLDLGINLTLPIKRYSYSLVRPDALSRITLGTLKYFEVPKIVQPQINTVSYERNVLQWAETVMAYVNQILGGTVRDVDAGLLVMTPLTSGRKNLSDIISRLNYVTPDYNGPTYNTPFRVRDPIAEIRRLKLASIQMAHSVIKDYISDMVGSGVLVTNINSAYANAYGAGTVVSFPPDAGLDIFGDYTQTSAEFLYANDVVNQLNNSVGNVSGIYLEIGSGDGGVIGAINRLYNMLSSHGITVSEGAPDDAVGKDGDLWFQYSDDEDD